MKWHAIEIGYDYEAHVWCARGKGKFSAVITEGPTLLELFQNMHYIMCDLMALELFRIEDN